MQGKLVSGPGVNLDQHRRNVGIVFQSFNLFPHMTVLRNITLAPRQVLRLSRKQAEERADTLLERVGLISKRSDYPDSLSGGQQQRVAIVRALAMQPRLLLLDEGVICEQGEPEQMFTEPTNPRTQAFLKRIIAAGRL
jgi:polar amino acid transport system ATP-binding protein